jgi:hypothetical protein
MSHSPSETKAAQSPVTHPTAEKDAPEKDTEEKLGTVHENLEGWIPALATEAEIREALEKAFDYRGDLTITLKNGQKIEGYVFDRKIKGPSLADCFIRLLPSDRAEKLTVAYCDVAALAFSGRDTAAGKSFAAWVKKYNEKKAAGEKNIGIEAESLD